MIPRGFIPIRSADDKRKEVVNVLAISSISKVDESEFTKVKTLDGKTHYSIDTYEIVTEEVNDAILETVEDFLKC